MVSDDYPQNGVFYDQDKLIKMYEVHLKHGEKMDFEQRAVKEVIYYQYDNGQLAKPTYKNKLSFRRIVKIDQVTGQNIMEYGKRLTVLILGVWFHQS
ncbi:hypothetical protein S100892_01081 [Pediococcus pentosaceus]|uniref:Mub B2-like domain-containing protein n=1 Tax=Pediococcus pentosaceus TaxID=1255 RepID=A0A1Y0VQC2_PEDPE|nr:hypothetical protein S100892_01081 [Pediococcus pentosaceus]